MARIAGINIPDRQHTEIGLTAIYGIGRTRARQICEAANVPYSKRVKDLSDAELAELFDLGYHFKAVDTVFARVLDA